MERLARGEWGEVLLPEYIVLEVLTVIAARCSHESAVHVGAVLLGHREIDLVSCSDFFAASFEVFRSHRALSFADAAIVAIARERRARVLSFDADFATVEGIEIVP